MKLNDLVDKALCLSLPDSPRRAVFSEHAKEIGLEFEFFDAITARSAEGRNRAQCIKAIEMIEKAEREGFDNLLYIEDDCFFTEPLPEDFKLPEKFDLFYLGHFNMRSGQIKPNEIYGRLNSALCIHAVIINKRAYKFLKKNIRDRVQCVDWAFLYLQTNGLSFGLKNQIAVQKDGYSERSLVNFEYSKLMERSCEFHEVESY